MKTDYLAQAETIPNRVIQEASMLLSLAKAFDEAVEAFGANNLARELRYLAFQYDKAEAA
ncbi:hypothetical protein MASR1M90_04410 [Desulfovibrionales bacterium]